MAQAPPPQLTCQAFTPHVGQRFVVRPTSGSVGELALLEAQTTGTAPDDGTRQSFSLVFGADDPTPLPQQIWTVEHQELGALAVFLVPIGPGQDAAMRYEAVFA